MDISSGASVGKYASPARRDDDSMRQPSPHDNMAMPSRPAANSTAANKSSSNDNDNDNSGDNSGDVRRRPPRSPNTTMPSGGDTSSVRSMSSASSGSPLDGGANANVDGKTKAMTEAAHAHSIPGADYSRRLSVLVGGFSNGDDANTLLPSRWWFAASAFPMIAGTLGPVASAFSICALVRPWRQEIMAGETIETATFLKDPVWLTTINAIQLVIALAANMFLLLNMARRIRFSIAQPVTMVGWFFSSFTLIALTSTASGPLSTGAQPGNDLVMSQAFYYAIYSAILYMLVASLMIVTFFGAWTGHYAKDFQLSNSQRTLMLQTILFLMYLLIGALIYSHIEGWAFLDAVYWADVTLFTVGFGDYAAETVLGRALLFPYALVGIISLGLVIGSIRSLALERGKNRLDARLIEKNRRKFLETLAKKGKDSILQPIRGDDQDHGENWSSFDNPRRNVTGMTEYERREEEFNIMRKIQHDASQKRRWLALATSGGTWVALWLIGAYIFETSERPYQDWDYFEGFYLAFVSLTTMGYGDTVPMSNAGKSFFVFWSLLALPTTTILISHAGDTIVKGISDATNAIGRITILPGERGLKRDFKEVIRALTCGAVFEDVDIEEVPPGLLGAAQPPPAEREESLEEEEEEEEEEAEEVVSETERSLRGQDTVDEEMAVGKASSAESDTDKAGVRGAPQNDGHASNSGNAPDFVKISARDFQASGTGGGGKGKAAAGPHSAGTLTTGDSPDAEKDAPIGGPRRARIGDQLHSSRRAKKRSVTMDAAVSSGGKQSFGYPMGSISTMSTPRVDLPLELPTSRAEYHCVLMDEIANVTKHLRHTPPRKYTFQEWAWFLKLIGEDETNAELHGRAKTPDRVKRRNTESAAGGGELSASTGTSRRPRSHHHHHHHKDHKELKDSNSDTAEKTDKTGNVDNDMGSSSGDEDGLSHLQWSWVGARSPLMGSQEEGEWILDKLTRRLQGELRIVRQDTLDYAQQRQPESWSQGHGHSGSSSGGGHINRRETHPIEEEP